MLQELLNKNLLIIKDETNFLKLKKSSEELSKKYLKERERILSYLLIGINPDIEADNKDLIEVRDLIIKTWNTFNVNTDTPVTYIRAVILEALEILSKDLNYSNLIWLGSRNIIRYYKITTSEKEVLLSFLTSLGKRVENNVAETPIYSTEFQVLKIGSVIKEVLDEILKLPEISTTSTQPIINKLLGKNYSQILENNNLLLMRSQLIWWKEASYCTSFKTSYKLLSPGVLEIALAFDYSQFVPYIYPISTDYFLTETYEELNKSSNESLNVQEILKLLNTHKDALKTILQEPNISQTKIPFLDYIQRLIWDKCTLKQLEQLTGIPNDTELTLSEFTLWIFHDLQAAKILKIK